MLIPRAIPCLLLRNQGLVKTVRFKDPKYLGDPINIVRLFNDKEVDEVMLLDITATVENRKPCFKLIEEVASEAFMPLGYGGGVRSLEDVKTILGLGVEKIVINSYAVENPDFVTQAADFAGSSSIVASIDVKQTLWGRYEVRTHSGRKSAGMDPVEHAKTLEKLGAGEILLNSIDRDGRMQGYDLELIKRVTQAVNVPVVACGGARTIQDLRSAVKDAGAAAAAAGSMFVFQGPHRAVLISYPSSSELHQIFDE